MITGHIDHSFSTEIDTRRGTVQLTSVWIVDSHDYLSPSKQEPTLYEVQFIDDKIHNWSGTIPEHFSPGDRVVALVKDGLEAVPSSNVDGQARAFIKARGLDLAAPLLDDARAQSNSQHYMQCLPYVRAV